MNISTEYVRLSIAAEGSVIERTIVRNEDYIEEFERIRDEWLTEHVRNDAWDASVVQINVDKSRQNGSRLTQTVTVVYTYNGDSSQGSETVDFAMIVSPQ